MFTGEGALVAKGGSRLVVTYEYIETAGKGWAGHIFGDLSDIDPGLFAETMSLECEDDVVVMVVVSQISDRELFFVGRQKARLAAE